MASVGIFYFLISDLGGNYIGLQVSEFLYLWDRLIMVALATILCMKICRIVDGCNFRLSLFIHTISEGPFSPYLEVCSAKIDLA